MYEIFSIEKDIQLFFSDLILWKVKSYSAWFTQDSTFIFSKNKIWGHKMEHKESNWHVKNTTDDISQNINIIAYKAGVGEHKMQLRKFCFW